MLCFAQGALSGLGLPVLISVCSVAAVLPGHQHDSDGKKKQLQGSGG